MTPEKRGPDAALSNSVRTAVLYVRVSSKDQEREGFSIPAQWNLLREYALDKGLVIEKEFADVETAKQAGRSGFGEMIAFLQKTPSCRRLVVEKTDRLYRNFRDLVTIDDLGLEIHFVKENVVLAPDSRSSEKFMHGIKVLMAKNYIDNLSEETRKGMLEKARQGIWPSYAPLGYQNVVGSDGKRTIIPEPRLGPVITRLYEVYATGKYSIKEMAKIAQADGLAYRKSGTKIPTSTIHKILRNRIYSGDFDFGGVTYHGKYPAIVSCELWEQVQMILDGRGAKKTRRVRDEFAFSGLITCGHCGCALVGEIKKGQYIYYHCTGYKGKCPERYTRQEVLERRFSQLLRGITFSDEVLLWVTQALKESHADQMKFYEETVVKLQRENSLIQDRIETMYLDKLDGRIDANFFDQRAAEWRSQQIRIMREIEVYRAANQSYLDQGIKLLKLAQHAHELFDSQPASEKRKLLDFVLSNCVWKEGELAAHYRQPFDILAIAVRSEKPSTLAVPLRIAQKKNWLPILDSNRDS